MATIYEDSNDALSYSKIYLNATNGFRQKDWVDAAFDWVVNVDLNGGINDDDNSNACLLAQLIPT